MDLDFLLAPFQYEFMNRAFIVVIMAALMCGLISCWLVLIGWSLMGDAVSHAVFPGVVISLILGWPFAIGAFFSALLAVLFIGHLRNNPRIKEDGAIGVVFTTMFAIGLVILSMVPEKGHLSNILFGSILGITLLDVYQIGILSILGMALLIYKRRDLTLYVFDPGHANAIGISTKALQNFLLITLALTIVVSVQAVGVIMVVAMLITPGVTASLLTQRISRMLIISPAVSVITSIIGLYASYIFDVSPGGTIILTMGIVFLAVYALSVVLPRWQSRRV